MRLTDQERRILTRYYHELLEHLMSDGSTPNAEHANEMIAQYMERLAHLQLTPFIAAHRTEPRTQWDWWHKL